MIKRLLVPLDGSTFAEAVLPVATQVVRALQGTLILFRVPNVSPSDIPLSVIEAEEDRALSYLAQVALRPELAGLPIERKTRCGAVVQGILAAVEADLVVMSSHGRAGLARLALGSVAEQVIRHAAVPVLVLHHAQAGEALHSTSSIALAALDGSPRAERILSPAADLLTALATQQEGTIHLLRIVPPPVEIRSYPGHIAPQQRQGNQNVQEAEDYLFRLTHQIQTEGIEGHA